LAVVNGHDGQDWIAVSGCVGGGRTLKPAKSVSEEGEGIGGGSGLKYGHLLSAGDKNALN